MRVAVLGGVALLAGSTLLAVPAAANGPTCAGQPATVVAAPGQRTVNGTAGDDVIVGNAGRNRIDAGAGNDIVCAGKGRDVVAGGEGDDSLFGEEGRDAVTGDRGNDHVSGGDGHDTLFAVSADLLTEGESDGDDKFSGGADDDSLVLEEISRPLRIDVRSRTVAGSGQDQLAGIEYFRGGRAADTFLGSPGSDSYLDYLGANVVRTFGGNDGFAGTGRVHAGPGDDRVFYHYKPALGHLPVHLGGGDDLCHRCNAMASGGRGRDHVAAFAGLGGSLSGGRGIDVLQVYGKDGSDYTPETVDVLVDLKLGVAQVKGEDDVLPLEKFESVRTGRGDDLILGSAGAEDLRGGRGDDVLRGRGGSDLLLGKLGWDAAYGGGGRDRCFAERRVSCER